ncbi:terminase small subunit [Xanthomonas arboricola]|uniref:terminase small subunit n=1 Tax=Xanthomonas arboricola TaxID=56448 RepID=UPI0009BBF542|nr:terminase small subunit [Xanthomonas arboricola]
MPKKKPKPKARAAPGLTQKQQRFVVEYLKDQNATQAAIRAGYSEKTARSVGSENLTKPDIAAAIQKAQAKVAQQAAVTVHSLAAELEEARGIAQGEKQASAMVAATMGKAKLYGLAVERHRHSGAIGTYDLSKLSDHELDRLESILGPLAVAGGDPSGEVEAGG